MCVEIGVIQYERIVEMPYNATHSGTWKYGMAAILFLFLVLGDILTQNPLNASLASLRNFCYGNLKSYLYEHKIG